MKLNELGNALDEQFKILIESMGKCSDGKKNSKEYRIDEFAVDVFVDMERTIRTSHNKNSIRDKAFIVITPANDEVKQALVHYFSTMETVPLTTKRAPSACFLFDKVVINSQKIL